MAENLSELMMQINEAVSYIRKYTNTEPAIGIVLGTGLGGIAKEIEPEFILDYEDIPHFAVSTVECHHGKLIIGKLAGKNVIAMQGRFHFYEGYTMQQITFPIRVMKYLGVKTLMVSNAGGSINPQFNKGRIMLIDDHINLLGANPLTGFNDDKIGKRFPDMFEAYNKKLIKYAEEIALEHKFPLYKGVYVAVPGPNLETKAEYVFLRTIGADVVGMSTIPEVIVARHMGLDVFGVSIITDEGTPENLKPCSIDEIIKTAAETEPHLTTLFKELVKKID